MLKRILSGAVCIAVTLFCIIFSRWTRVIFIAVLACVACYEMNKAIRHDGCKITPWCGYAVLGLYLFFSYLPIYVDPLLLAILLCIGILFLQKILQKDFSSRDMFASLCPIFYPVIGSIMILRVCQGIGAYTGFVLLSSLSGAILCDTFALFGGLAFGKHKLIPYISPNKTIEGSVSGLLFGTASGIAVYYLLPMFHLEVPALWFCILCGFVASVTGSIGDLAASSVKREAGIKDFGNVIPGHGGILDRIDSALFAVSAVWILTVLFA